MGEVGVAYTPIQEQFELQSTKIAIVEPMLQVQPPFRVLQPYAGVGVGALAYLTQAGGRGPVNATYVTSAGARVRLSERVRLVAEGRLRGWDRSASGGLINSSGEVTLGVMRAF